MKKHFTGENLTTLKCSHSIFPERGSIGQVKSMVVFRLVPPLFVDGLGLFVELLHKYQISQRGHSINQEKKKKTLTEVHYIKK